MFQLDYYYLDSLLGPMTAKVFRAPVPIRDERKPTSTTSIKKTQQIDFAININF
jgi:hypothetical protein